MMGPQDELQRLQEASQWWVRLQESEESELAGEWIAWIQQHPDNLPTFQHIESLAVQLKRVNARQRRELLRELSGSHPVSSDADGSSRIAHWLASLTCRAAGARSVVAAISAILVIAALGVVFLASGGWPWARGSDETAVYATLRDQQRTVNLADGSRVTIGRNSMIEVGLSRDLRQINLRDGEVLFEVARDPKRPFVVDAGELLIRAIGTAFKVSRSGKRVSVDVTQGQTRVTWLGKSALDVGAGEVVFYDAADGSLGWRLEFVNQPLDAVIARVNHFSKWHISITDSQVGQLTFTGTIMSQRLESWLTALPQVLPVKVDRRGLEVMISGA